jgi:hypothetical protein
MAVKDGRKTKGDDVDPTEWGREAKVLPAREALSLISADPLSAYDFADPAVDGASARDAATLPDTHAEASGAGDQSVTSDDPREHFGRSDSASAET